MSLIYYLEFFASILVLRMTEDSPKGRRLKIKAIAKGKPCFNYLYDSAS